MQIFYSKSTGGFYIKEVHRDIPEDRVEISTELHQTLVEGQSNGKQIIADRYGRPILVEPQPSEFHEWNGTKWVIAKKDKVQYEEQRLAQAKASKLTEINQKAQAFVNAVAKLDETPEFERSTWQEQANEARAWFENRETPTPKLDLLAQQRGVPAEVLRMKCYEKATAFYQLSFIVAGQRQGLEDRLKQAATIEEIEAIEIAYQLPQGGV